MIGMARVGFSIVTSVDPDIVFNAMIDFSDRRPEFWPALHPGAYEVHELGDTWAEVTEGSEPDVIRWSPFALHRKGKAAWARQRYSWSATDRTVRWTVVESPWIHVPGPAEYRVSPHDHGSRIELSMDRSYKGVSGKLMELAMRLAGSRMMIVYWHRHLALLEGRADPQGGLL
jgi:hypothetical protein